jgi:O-antigen/teichoic acid export membrane protein
MGTNPTPRTFSSQLVRGSVWMVAMRWALRLIGLVSTAILARLLTPADFGIVAMAAIVAGLLDTAAYAGVDLALIRANAATRELHDSAWTIQVGQGAIVGGLLVLSAPFVASYFDEPRVAIVLQCLAVRSIVDGFQNIGIVAFRQELDFAKEFRFNLYTKILNFVIVVAAAFAFRNYLALVIGMVSGAAINVALSYLMHPYRPRFSLAKVKDLWSFSNWLLVSRIGNFLSRKADQLIVGGAVGTTALGHYHIATELSTMPTTELVMPMRRALFPTLSKLQADPTAFRGAVLQTFAALAIMCFSVGFGIMSTAAELVPVLLGQQWVSAIPMVRWLALYGAFAGLVSILEVPMWVRGKTNISALQAWIEVVALVPLIVVAVGAYGVEGAAVSRMLVAAAVLPMMLYLASRVCDVRLRELTSVLWRPLAAGLLMVLVLEIPVSYPSFLVLALAAKVAIGAATYIGALMALWVVSGRPEGIEASVFRRFGVASKPGV